MNVATLKKYDIDGKELGELEVDAEKISSSCSSQLIKDYIVAIRRNKRQWSASTKGRAEVKHTTKKPHPQKKTGKARHGDLVGPQFRGGGIVFGPKPKFDQHVSVNKKERRKAIDYLMAEKVKGEHCSILDAIKLSEVKTKMIANFLEKAGQSGRILFLLDVGDNKEDFQRFSLSARNIPKVKVCQVQNVSGYDLAQAKSVICTEEALKQMEWTK